MLSVVFLTRTGPLVIGLALFLLATSLLVLIGALVPLPFALLARLVALLVLLAVPVLLAGLVRILCHGRSSSFHLVDGIS
ncbi:MAG TPA: hypothetical protein VNR60_02700 [Croceibacterium sp.]|nr:hypothetical protein [Croceibacterium sp.]